MKDELEKKRLELIGERFGYAYPEAYALIAREFRADSAWLVAIQLCEYFPLAYQQMEAEAQQEYEDWISEFEASLDPPMDKFDYLRPEV